MDDLDPSCILPAGTRRVSRVPTRYVDEDYVKLMLADVHKEEMFAALDDDDVEGDEEEEDDDSGSEANSEDRAFVEDDASDSDGSYNEGDDESADESDESDESDDESADESTDESADKSADKSADSEDEGRIESPVKKVQRINHEALNH